MAGGRYISALLNQDRNTAQGEAISMDQQSAPVDKLIELHRQIRGEETYMHSIRVRDIVSACEEPEKLESFANYFLHYLGEKMAQEFRKVVREPIPLELDLFSAEDETLWILTRKLPDLVIPIVSQWRGQCKNDHLAYYILWPWMYHFGSTDDALWAARESIEKRGILPDEALTERVTGGQTDPQELIPTLLDWLGSNHNSVRQRAANVLGFLVELLPQDDLQPVIAKIGSRIREVGWAGAWQAIRNGMTDGRRWLASKADQTSLKTDG